MQRLMASLAVCPSNNDHCITPEVRREKHLREKKNYEQAKSIHTLIPTALIHTACGAARHWRMLDAQTQAVLVCAAYVASFSPHDVAIVRVRRRPYLLTGILLSVQINFVYRTLSGLQ